VAEVAGAVGHLDVGAYHNLAMATRAAKLLSPPQVSQMEPVIEADSFFVNHLPRQDFGGMAAHAQAARIFDLGIRFGAVFSGYNLDDVVKGLKLGP